MIAFDTEFIRENTFYPIVEIIQVATEEESWLVDAQAFKKNFSPGPDGGFDPGLNPLLEIFQDPSILKILHAAQGDQECLYTSFGVTAKPTMDTAVAASLCGHGDAIGLGKLLKSTLNVSLAKGHARTNWSVRPLPRQLIEYAHADVDHLVALGRHMIRELDRLRRREWALQISAKWEEPALYQVQVSEIAEKIARGGRLDSAGYGALLELVRWREERVRYLNLPRRWVADDAVLLDLAAVRPKDRDHLSAFRGLNKGELKNSGDTILGAIKRGSEAGVKAPPKPVRHEVPSSDESQALELLKCFIGILADRHRIAAKHLLTTGQLLDLLRARPKTVEDLVKNDILSESAGSLIGTELIAFLSGKRALSIQGEKVSIANLEER